MGRYFYKGIKFKITLAFSIVFIAINVIFSGVTYRYFKDAYTDSYNKYLYNRAQTIINRTEINPDLIALPDSGESIRVFYHNNNRQPVIVFQSPGVISKLTIPYRSGVTDSLGQHGVYVKKEDFDGRPVELLLTVSNTPLVKKLNNLSWLMVLATFFSVCMSAVASYFAAGLLLKPVRSIADEASQINIGKLNRRLDVSKTYDELQQLSETINAMLGRIEHEQQLQNNFFAAASHELRTPLANLQAETELHLTYQPDDANRQVMISQLQEINRLQHIVEQFLLISQFNHKGITINKRPTDISDQLLKVFRRNRFLADKQEVRTTINFGNNITNFIINGDSDKLEVVWQNLLQNALKYALTGSIVICEIEQKEANLTIAFVNQISEKSIATDNLTDAFVTSQPLTSGTGLGLWISNQIVAAHGGSISLKSQDHHFHATVSLPMV